VRLVHLHASNIVHRDLAARNVLLAGKKGSKDAGGDTVTSVSAVAPVTTSRKVDSADGIK
jgi:serine/threonine protein kinase